MKGKECIRQYLNISANRRIGGAKEKKSEARFL